MRLRLANEFWQNDGKSWRRRSDLSAHSNLTLTVFIRMHVTKLSGWGTEGGEGRLYLVHVGDDCMEP